MHIPSGVESEWGQITEIRAGIQQICTKKLINLVSGMPAIVQKLLEKSVQEVMEIQWSKTKS